MTIIVAVLIGAMIVGRLRGGSLRQLAQLRLPRTGLVMLAAGFSLLGQFGGRLGLPSRSAYIVCSLISAGLAASFVYTNRRVVGVPLIAIGFFLNALVIAANGAMPVSQQAADFARVSTDAAADGSDAKHELMTPRTRLRPLADVVALRLPEPVAWGSNVYSAGDLVLAAGIAMLVIAGMKQPEDQSASFFSSTRVNASTTRGSYS